MSDRRYYPIPDGFAGDRVDSVVARMTDSHDLCARLIEEGAVWWTGCPHPNLTVPPPDRSSN